MHSCRSKRSTRATASKQVRRMTLAAMRAGICLSGWNFTRRELNKKTRATQGRSGLNFVQIRLRLGGRNDIRTVIAAHTMTANGATRPAPTATRAITGLLRHGAYRGGHCGGNSAHFTRGRIVLLTSPNRLGDNVATGISMSRHNRALHTGNNASGTDQENRAADPRNAVGNLDFKPGCCRLFLDSAENG